MSRPRYTYTSAQLLALQYSPLIEKPENLPRIDQWIETTSDTNQRKPRTQSSATGAKGEENEYPHKRPSLFETRQRQGHSYSANEDVFLGPKITFASATAARHNKRFAGDDKAGTDESKDKLDRFGSRERFRRDPYHERDKEKDGRDGETESYRPRYARQNGTNEEDEPRPRRFGDFHERTKEPREGGVALDGRRSGPPRGRLDQPWHRFDSKNDDKVNSFDKEEAHEPRGWRDGGDRRPDRWNPRDNPRLEKDPKWMKDTLGNDSENPSQEDFERWKEKMKAGTDPKPQISERQALESDSASATPQPPNPPEQIIPEDGLFGIFGGGSKLDQQKPEGAPPTPKAAAKPKASRFAGIFKQEQPVESPAAEEPSSPMQPMSKRTTEDQEGFARMMQMLRMGGTPSQGPPTQLFGKPSSGEFPGETQTPRSPISQTPERSVVQPSNPATSATGRRPEIQSRDSQFLLKLMQQPQQTAFNEGEIYGQNFPRTDMSGASNSTANSAGHTLQQQEARTRAPPPGLYGGEHGFQGSQGLDGQIRDARPRHATQMSGDERFGVSQAQRFSPADEGRPQQPPMFNQFPPQNPNSRGTMHPSQQLSGQDGLAHPPGFPPSLGQGPPFPPFSGHHQMVPAQYGNGPPPPPPNMRTGQMQSPHSQQPPPGFFGGPPPPPPPPPGMPGQGFPPGFGPPPQMNNMHAQPPPPQPQQQHGQQMRPPPGMPPGQDMYGDGVRRGQGSGPSPGGPMGSHWPPRFLKDVGGGYPQ